MANSISLKNDYPNISKSLELYNRATQLIPKHSQTLAKSPSQFVFGSAPIYLQAGKGSHVWDVDGNEYIDLIMGVGPISLGYAYPKVDEAIKNQLNQGITFSLPHPLEIEVSEMLREIIPNAEAVRFSKIGNDVTAAAVRLARAYTGRDQILLCGYHGSQDWYIGVTEWNKGVPKSVQDLTYTFNYNDIQSLKDAIDHNVAAVIMEPVTFEFPKNNFLQEVKEICTQNGSLLIFDEMWTGFRISLGGAQEYFGIKADLATFSKACANGMPIAVLAGRWDIMKLLEEEVFFYGTFGGETLSLAATKATLEELKEKNVPQYLNEKGAILRDGYNDKARSLGMDYTRAEGYGYRSAIKFDPVGSTSLELKTLVQQEMIKRGVLWGGYNTMSFSHTDDDINYVLSAYEDTLPILKKAVDENNVRGYLRGATIEPSIRRIHSFNTKPKKKQ